MTEDKDLRSRRIAILGAGISGMTAAWTLMKQKPSFKFEIWEAQNQVGGAIRTVEKDGFQIEQGVDNFITTVPEGLDLCRELGLIDDVIPTNNRYRRTFVVHQGKLYPLPDGFMMMAPTKLWPLAVTPLLSPLGKIRAGLELFLPRRKNTDETMAEFVQRRLGREVFERIVEPLVSGIYAGDAQRLSVWATLPRFPEMEVKYRSLILAMRAQLHQARSIKKAEESGARYSFFVALKHGLHTLPQKIADNLPERSLFLNRKISDIHQIIINGQVLWSLTDQYGISRCYDALISTLPAPVVGKIFCHAAPNIADFYRQIETSSVAIITVAFKNEQIKKPMIGMGYVVPKIENAEIIAGSFSNYKYPCRAPENTTMIRLFAGGARTPDLVNHSDEEIIAKALEELRPLLQIEGEPILVNLSRWPEMMPQYNKGHLTWVENLCHGLQKYPSLAMAGNALDGVGIPNCIKKAKEAAGKIIKYLEKR